MNAGEAMVVSTCCAACAFARIVTSLFTFVPACEKLGDCACALAVRECEPNTSRKSAPKVRQDGIDRTAFWVAPDPEWYGVCFHPVPKSAATKVPAPAMV